MATGSGLGTTHQLPENIEFGATGTKSGIGWELL